MITYIAIKIILFAFKLINVVQTLEYAVDDENEEYKKIMLQIIADGNNLKPEDWKLLIDVKFKYWPCSSPNQKIPFNIIFNKEYQLLDYWEEGRPLKVIIHGWLHSDKSDGVFSIKSAYLYPNKFNVITVDWSAMGNKINYWQVAKSSAKVGIILGYFLTNLLKYNIVKPYDMHVIGHSIGAHISGMSGHIFFNVTGKKIARITGLDPSSPAFSGSCLPYLNNKRLNTNNAEFVDVIHTTRGVLGISKSIGHADFYPNNGVSPQPHCPWFIPIIRLDCSHSSAYRYYRESVNNPNFFESLRCTSMKDFVEGKCNGNDRNYMGHHANKRFHGIFYLKTSREGRYGITSLPQDIITSPNV